MDLMPLRYQQDPHCFGCGERIESEVIYASLCGHDTCPSTCWHYDHLMAARDAAETAQKAQGNVAKAINHLLIILRGM